MIKTSANIISYKNLWIFGLELKNNKMTITKFGKVIWRGNFNGATNTLREEQSIIEITFNF